MRIAIASLGKNEDSEISNEAGRAPFYLIFEDGKLVETLKNIFRFGGGGSGISVAKMLSDNKVKKVIAGKFGPNVKTFFEEKNIEVIEKTGKVLEVLKWMISKPLFSKPKMLS